MENNWLYMDESIKENMVKNFYNIIDISGTKWVQCFKTVRKDYTSIYKKELFKYDTVGKLYETVCDYNSTNKNSFGFGCWTLHNAISHARTLLLDNNYKLIKVHVPLNSICMLSGDGKIRSINSLIKSMLSF